jgi:hypothetical protein
LRGCLRRSGSQASRSAVRRSQRLPWGQPSTHLP